MYETIMNVGSLVKRSREYYDKGELNSSLELLREAYEENNKLPEPIRDVYKKLIVELCVLIKKKLDTIIKTRNNISLN